MKRLIKSAAACLLGVSLITLTPAVANAVTASGSDPSGDVTIDPSYDILSQQVNLTSTQITVTLAFNASVPALTDSSWAKGNNDGRILVVGLGESLNDAFVLDADGLFLLGPKVGLPRSCTGANDTISGSTVTLTAPASCFDYPGKVGVASITADSVKAPAGHYDVALAPAESANLSGITDVYSNANVTTLVAQLGGGYYQLGQDGGVFAFGDAQFYGSTGSLKLNAPVVAMEAQPNDTGYRFAASDGGIFAYGNAPFFGSMGGKPLNKPIVGMASTPTGNGYWMVASDGGIFAYGDAQFYGSMGGKPLNQPIVGMAPTPSGQGYWLVASDGGIFAYGDAQFYGSTGAMKLNSPIVGMTSSHDGKGYLLAAKDGGVFSYGDTTFQGSGTKDFNNNVVAIGSDGTDNGYYLADNAGDVVNYGTVSDFGDIARLDLLQGKKLNAPTVGLTVEAASS
jgi:hypothetical protein